MVVVVLLCFDPAYAIGIIRPAETHRPADGRRPTPASTAPPKRHLRAGPLNLAGRTSSPYARLLASPSTSHWSGRNPSLGHHTQRIDLAMNDRATGGRSGWGRVPNDGDVAGVERLTHTPRH